MKGNAPTNGPADPFDTVALEAGIARAHERLKVDLSKLRAGGRFNSEVVENLHVVLDKSGKETAKLSDVAQVAAKGRVLNILVGAKEVGFSCATHIRRRYQLLTLARASGKIACQGRIFGHSRV